MTITEKDRKIEHMESGFTLPELLLALVGTVVSLAVTGLVVFVVVHFLRKWW